MLGALEVEKITVQGVWVRISGMLGVAASVALGGCDARDDGGDARPPAVKRTAPAPEAPAPAADAKPDPWQQTLAGRVLAESGLGVGGRLAAFPIVNAESGERYCQVCRYGPAPKIMAIGRADDPGFREDLRDLDAIAFMFAPEVKAFAVVTELGDGEATVPADPQAARTRAEALREELRLTMPVVVPARPAAGEDPVWREYYNVTASRTVMFADGRNVVRYSGVAPDDFSGLDVAIREVLGKNAGRAPQPRPAG